MTQAYNLAILANAVDTSGKLNVGTNATGTLPVANGGTGLTATPSNGQIDIGNGSGFTRTTLSAGSGISITNGAGSITIASSGGSGTVTSVATGNGLSGGTITTSGTLTIACPTFNTVGSYCLVGSGSVSPPAFLAGSNYAAGSGGNQLLACYNDSVSFQRQGGNISGTWKWMSANNGGSPEMNGIACRVS